jgi:hypothetical protein
VYGSLKEGHTLDNVSHQVETLTLAVEWYVLGGKNPKPQQIRVLRRLVYKIGDTILAKTGFGKSAVFHGFSVLTSEITIQMMPLFGMY